MPTDDSERSLSDGGTFAEQPKVERDDVSLGGDATFAGSAKRRAAEMSLGDERTFGDRLDNQETVIDDIEIVDLAARYKTEGTLGRGGMGEVLLGLDTRLDRKVAIKRILGEAARSKTAVSRFLTEAKATGGLSAIPVEVLDRLPAKTFAGLPSAALAAMHPVEVAAMSPVILAAIPHETISALPPLRSSIGIKLKLIPPGQFTMGQAGGSSDETPHLVTLTKPFYIGVYEVTNAQWKAVMGSVPSDWKGDDNPVTHVSWKDAVEFCRKLSALPEEQRAGREYRLPTEAEWEYSCRAGTNTRYSFGDDESRSGEYGWFGGNCKGRPQAVGKKKPNARGLYHMHGNVWEWCSDWHGDYSSGAAKDPQGPSWVPKGSSGVAAGGMMEPNLAVRRTAPGTSHGTETTWASALL